MNDAPFGADPDALDITEHPDGQPNWQAIALSPLWKLQVEPWLRVLYFEALEEMAPAGPPGTPTAALATLETYQYHRGRVDAFRQILNTPEGEMALKAAREQQDADAKRRAELAAAKRRRPRA